MSNNNYQYLLLKELVGEEGVNALYKAANSNPDILGVFIPRAILAWVDALSRVEYEGNFPGTKNGYVEINKSENGYTGKINIDNFSYLFKDEGVSHIAASVLVGLNLDISDSLCAANNVILSKLGKSLDSLVKMQFLKSIGISDLKGGISDNKKVHIDKDLIEEGAKVELEHTDNLEIARKIATDHLTERKDYYKKLKLVEKPPKAKQRSFRIAKSQMYVPCSLCGKTQFVNNELVGCSCFKELIKSFNTQNIGNQITFNYDLNDCETDEVEEFVKSFFNSDLY